MENKENNEVMEEKAPAARKPRAKKSASSGNAPKRKKREEINVDDYLGHNTPAKPKEDVLATRNPLIFRIL
jgi:hypothetical protein